MEDREFPSPVGTIRITHGTDERQTEHSAVAMAIGLLIFVLGSLGIILFIGSYWNKETEGHWPGPYLVFRLPTGWEYTLEYDSHSLDHPRLGGFLMYSHPDPDRSGTLNAAKEWARAAIDEDGYFGPSLLNGYRYSIHELNGNWPSAHYFTLTNKSGDQSDFSGAFFLSNGTNLWTADYFGTALGFEKSLEILRSVELVDTKPEVSAIPAESMDSLLP